MTITDFIAYLSLIVSATALWRAREVKQLDLRIELQKSFNYLDDALSSVENYLDFVYESHRRVMAATGRLGSGEEKSFISDFSADKEKLELLLGLQPKRKENYKKCSQDELEKELVAVHSYQNQIAGLRMKYQKIFEADEERRKEIKAQHQN